MYYFIFKNLLLLQVNVTLIKYANKNTWVPEIGNGNWTEVSPEPMKTMNRWTGVPGTVHQTSNGTVFYYKTNHNTSAGE